MIQYIKREDVLAFADSIRPAYSDYFNAGYTETLILNRVDDIADDLERLPFIELPTEEEKKMFCKINGAPCSKCNPSCTDNKISV